MIQNQHLTSTMEDYLETIFILSREKGAIRIKNIAKRLGVKMPTVTNMLKNLNEKGFIDYEKHEFLELTEKGLAIGKEIDRRHEIIRSFLTDILKIDYWLADEEACKMEHGMSPETLNRLIKFIDFVQSCPMTGESWLKYFNEYCQFGFETEKCLEHMEKFSKEDKKELILRKKKDENRHQLS
ncbi:MAG: metal-dependent transcriptional regulator [Deltaproteobacteria bacterium]|nr:metal-dependent transcriptional regulator [Deltaproteobacteria bacterium]